MSANKCKSHVAGFLNRLRCDTSGNTLAMMAAAMVPLAGMIGGGLDMSRAYMAQAKLQNACDAGALAARQNMAGTTFTSSDIATAQKYFSFNFPAGTMNANNVNFSIGQNSGDPAALNGSATATIPTSLMKIFSYDEIDISVDCNVKRDLGNNDIMVVLDVTGSMNCDPGYFPNHVDCDGDSNSKIVRLRNGAMGLYRALQDGSNARTRFGLMPYSGTVNVGGSLANRDILRKTRYADCNNWSCSSITYREHHINNSPWKTGNTTGQAIAAWRNSGSACVEERPTIGNPVYPNAPEIGTTVTQDDIDARHGGGMGGDVSGRRWGRYEPNPIQSNGSALLNDAPHNQTACPSEATRLTQYGTEATFQTAINNATSNVTGGTYHDVGMIWGLRFLSPTGIFANNNPSTFNNFPVNKHIVFMTDGLTDTMTNPWYYSTMGVQRVEGRMKGSGDNNANHVARFHSVCSRARSMNVTVWVIALDVGDPDDPEDPASADIRPCATSKDHFFTSNGTDLEAVFTKIGQGIGDLRLTS